MMTVKLLIGLQLTQRLVHLCVSSHHYPSPELLIINILKGRCIRISKSSVSLCWFEPYNSFCLPHPISNGCHMDYYLQVFILLSGCNALCVVLYFYSKNVDFL